MTPPAETLLIEFETSDPVIADEAQETFVDEETIRASSFDGAIVVTIITLSITIIKLAFKFYAKHRDSLSSAKLNIDGKKVTFEGFSADEIHEMIEKGNIEKIIQKLNEPK